MDAVINLFEAELGTACDGGETEGYPFTEYVEQAFLAWAAIATYHHQVDRC